MRFRFVNDALAMFETAFDRIERQLSRIAHGIEDLYRAQGPEEGAWWDCEHCGCSSNWYLADACKVCGVEKPKDGHG